MYRFSKQSFGLGHGGDANGSSPPAEPALCARRTPPSTLHHTHRLCCVCAHAHICSFICLERFLHLNYKTAPVTYNATSLHIGKDGNSVEGTVISVAWPYTDTWGQAGWGSGLSSPFRDLAQACPPTAAPRLVLGMVLMSVLFFCFTSSHPNHLNDLSGYLLVHWNPLKLRGQLWYKTKDDLPQLKVVTVCDVTVSC